MNCRFLGAMELRESGEVIPVPFNVWEVCDEADSMPNEVTVGDLTFACRLSPRGQGYYDIPVPAEAAEKLKNGVEYGIVLRMVTEKRFADSPYGKGHPIRSIDGIKLVTQPWDGLCGQSCIAMLAGISLDDACEVMHCREWQANMGRMIDTLDYLGLEHSDTVVYTLGRKAEFPRCCIVMERMGRYGHYLVKYEDRYYDPNMGVLDEFDQENAIGYVEVY